MTALLLAVSARALPRRAVALPLAAVLVLLAVAWPALDGDGGALLVLRGVAVLLATALALAVDEPAAQLLDATPTPLGQRLAARTAVCAVLVLPAWGLALVAASAAGADVPLAAMTLELAGLVGLGLAVPMSLRRWWGAAEPAVVVGPVLLGALIAASHLPERLSLLPFSPQDPSWGRRAPAVGPWCCSPRRPCSPWPPATRRPRPAEGADARDGLIARACRSSSGAPGAPLVRRASS
jgi:hypothetical protein